MTEDQVAVLISYIGNLVEMNYSVDESLAYIEDLTDKVFKVFGISSSFVPYDPNIVKTSLIDGFPVIVSAGNNSSSHALIIDGYKRFRIEYTYTYEWVYDFPTEEMIEIKKPKCEVEYSSPYIDQVQMNWGWGDNYPTNELSNNNVWYNPTDSWVVNHIENEIPFTEEYNIKSDIIYNFSKDE